MQQADCWANFAYGDGGGGVGVRGGELTPCPSSEHWRGELE